jgi:hypothetical protein
LVSASGGSHRAEWMHLKYPNGCNYDPTVSYDSQYCWDLYVRVVGQPRQFFIQSWITIKQKSAHCEPRCCVLDGICSDPESGLDVRMLFLYTCLCSCSTMLCTHAIAFTCLCSCSTILATCPTENSSYWILFFEVQPNFVIPVMMKQLEFYIWGVNLFTFLLLFLGGKSKNGYAG